MNASIEIDGLRKRFGSTQAQDGMTFTVHPGQVTGPAACPTQPTAPGGEPVVAAFYFAHQPVTGNGTITVQVTSLTGQVEVGVQSLPLTRWQGLGVVALWTPGALLLGALAVKIRDRMTRRKGRPLRCPSEAGPFVVPARASHRRWQQRRDDHDQR